MQLEISKDHYGKLVLVVSASLIWLLILVLFKAYGYEKTWQLWKVPTEMPPFVDFRLIPGSAESFLRGYEPTLENPYDPRGRIFNYPMVWRLFFYSGVTQDDAIWVSVIMIVLFFTSVFLFPQNLSVTGAIWMLLVVFSPASMLLYERGNVDLIVFFLCTGIVLASSYSAYIATMLLMAGMIIKLFPFFGVSVLLRESKTKFIWLAVACFGVLLLYITLTLDSIGAAWNLTLRGNQISYGANVFFYRYEQLFSQSLADWFRGPEIDRILKLGPIALASILILIAGIFGLRNRQPSFVSSERNLSAFRMGASIYVGTFLLGNNWDYRLAFLILVIPQLLEWTRSLSRAYRYTALLSLFAVVASCWHFVFWYSPSIYFSESSREVWFVIDESLNWMLVPGFTYLLFASFPDWAKESVGFSPAKQVHHDAVRPGLEK
jgi:hypothetical protein